MTDATHAYVVWQGGFKDWPFETWQVGVRYMLVNSGTEPDHVGTLPTFTVNATAVGRDETDWTISSLWDAGLGLTETISVDDWLNDQLAPAGLAMMANCFISTQCTLTSIKASPITGTGHVADLRTSVLEFKPTVPDGTVSVPQLPAECSIVASWITQKIGRKGRGRIYLPPTGSAILVDGGGLNTSAQDHIVAGAVAMLEASAITPTGPGNHWALPVVTGAPYTSYAQIDGVRVGQVVDSQRRRRRQTSENYRSAAVTYG